MSFGGETVGQAYVEIHAIPSPALSAETAAIAERTAAQIQSKLTPAVARASRSINTAALGIAAGLALIGKKAVMAFSDTVEALNVTDVAFKQNAAGVKKWATGLSSSFGLTNRQILQTSSNFGLLLQNADLGLEASTDLAKQLTQRAGDLSSFFNIRSAQAVDKLTAGLVGETRAVRDLGIDVSETAVKAKALELGIQGYGGELQESVKVQIRARLIMEDSSRAMGDAERTAGTFEGRLRTLRGEVGDLAEKIGGDLVPSLGVLGIGAEETVKTLNQMPAPLRAVAVNLGALLTGAVGVSFVIQKLAPAFAGVRTALSVVGSGLKLGGSLLAQYGLTLLGPLGAVAGLVALGKATAPPIAGIKELNGLLDNSDALLDAFFVKASKEHGPGIFDTARDMLFGATKDYTEQTADELRRAIINVYGKDPALAQRIVEAAERDSGSFGTTYAKGLRAQLDKLTPDVLPEIKIPITFDFVETAADALKATVSGLDSIASANKGVATAQAAAQDAAKSLTALQAQTLEFPKLAAAANTELVTANNRVAEATQHLNELEAKRAETLADTASEARELADAEAAVYRARRQLQDLDQSREQTLRDLAELQREGPEDLAAADRAILRAKIALNDATREAKELQDSLNKSQAASPDLTGLSLDQIKTKLAGARAQLAVQRQSKNTQKSAQQIEDEALTAKLNVLDAEQAHKDAIEARTDLVYDQGIRQRELDETLADLAVDREDTLRRQTEVQDTLNRLRDGETTRAQTIKTLDGQIKQAKEDQVTAIGNVLIAEDAVKKVEQDRKTLNDEIKAAKLAQRDAENEVAQAILDRKQAVAEILKDETEINRLLADRIKDLPAATSFEQNLQKQLLAGAIPTLLTSAVMINPLTGVASGPAVVTQNLIEEIVTRLLRYTGNDLLGELRNIMRYFGLRINGMRSGGLVEQAPTSFGTLHRLGEAGIEAVLPLSDGSAMRRLLGDSRILNPVLANLPKISLPTRTVASLPSRLNAARGSNVVGQAREERRQKQLMKEAFLEALKEAGQPTGDNVVTMHVNQTAPTAQLSARELERAVAKALRR